MAEVTMDRIVKLARKLPQTALSATPVFPGRFTPEIDNNWWPSGGGHLVKVGDNTYLLVEPGDMSGWVLEKELGLARPCPVEQLGSRLQAQLLRLRSYERHCRKEKSYWCFELLLDMGFTSEVATRLLNLGENPFSAVWWLIDNLSERHEEFLSLCDFFLDSVSATEPKQALDTWRFAGIIVPTMDEAGLTALFGIVETVLSDAEAREVLRNLIEPEVLIAIAG